MKQIVLFLAMLAAPALIAQVKIGANGTSPQPHGSAGLEVDFSTRGFLPPRMNTAERTAITSPSPGLMVYNTDINCLEFYNGGSWFTLCGQEAPCSVAPASPQATAAGDFSTTQFRANWNSVAGANSYRLQASLQSNFSVLLFDQNVGNVNWADVGGLSEGDVCYYRVAALNDCGASAYSNVISLTIPDGQVQGLVTTPASSVLGTSAYSGGSYTSDGGVVPTDRGVCWSTSPSPTIADSFASSGPGSGDFVTQITGLAQQTLYYARAYVTNGAGTFYGNEISFTTLEWSPQIGEYFEGGHIFYLDGTGLNGMVISQANQVSDNAAWGCTGQFITGAGGTAVGTGESNTSNIAAQCQDFNVAAQVCADLVEEGYDDWFLPSKEEFQLAWDNVTPLGYGVQPGTWQYWTSTQINEYEAWFFGSGGLGWGPGWKGDGGRNVRCIRSFCTTAPAGPAAQAPNGITSSQFIANWSNLQGASGYTLQVSDQSDFSNLILDQAAGAATSYTVSGLNASTTYYYRVIAETTCGTSSPSNTVQVNTLPPPSCTNYSDWDYYREVQVTNGSGDALSEYQVSFVFDHQTLVGEGKSQASASDIRVTSSVNCEPLAFWIDPATANTSQCEVWVKMPSLSPSGSETIRMFYGNGAAATASNGFDTFVFFDDFADGDFSNWTVTGGTFDMTSDVYMSNAIRDIDQANGRVVSPAFSGTMNWAWHFDFRSETPFQLDALPAISDDSDQGYGFYLTDSGILQFGYGNTSWRETPMNLIFGSWSLDDARHEVITTKYGDDYALYSDGVPQGTTNSAQYGSGWIPNRIVLQGNSSDYRRIQYDNIFVRNFHPQQPSVSVGGELGN
jgi:hypothetical protein